MNRNLACITQLVAQFLSCTKNQNAPRWTRTTPPALGGPSSIHLSYRRKIFSQSKPPAYHTQPWDVVRLGQLHHTKYHLSTPVQNRLQNP